VKSGCRFDDGIDELCSVATAEASLNDRWIEPTYHRRRRQRALGKLTPIEYEMIISKTATLAA
jgi:hypothetical protein